jgi:thiaminase (transcriptional activator TenA)
VLTEGERTVSARLREIGGGTWESATGHPMVKEIAAGTLPHRSFRRYFEQNISYLEDYTRALAMVLSKAPDTDALEVLGRLLGQIITVELPANHRFLQRLGANPAEPGGLPTMEPTTYAYTRHLLATAALGDCAAGLTAVLPCQWSYGEIGARIAGARPDDPIYADWIAVFGDPGYAELVSMSTDLLDRLAAPNEETFDRLQVIFDVSTRYEVEFWDMAYEPSPSSS